MFVALHNGCVETIIAYGKILHTADLTPHQASKLLAAEGPNGVSGLIIAFQNRNFEAIKTYMEIIKNENITPEEIAEHLDKKMEVIFWKL